MERTIVYSSGVFSAGYDPDDRVLEVEFFNGHVFSYFDVPPGIGNKLMKSKNFDRSFGQVRSGQFKNRLTERLGPILS
mgnify:CR=1 FL=1